MSAEGVIKFGFFTMLVGAGVGFGSPVLATAGGVFFDSIGGNGQEFFNDVMQNGPVAGFAIGGIGAFICAMGFAGLLAGSDDHE
jgi:hypothetical protein